MTRWRDLARRPERPLLDWDPDRWWLDYPWQGLVIVPVLCFLIPSAAMNLALAAPVLFLFFGFLWALTAMWIALWWRRRRRKRLSAQVRADDWVCARCLHTRPASVS